jgi:hypothetical protein
MSILKFSGKANPAASAENVRYITRERACADLSFHNLDELKAESQGEARANALAYAETRKDIEARQPPPPRGIARNHHRMILSFDREETPERAREQAHQFLRENFPDARAIVAVHTDKKEMTHCHVWLDCRTRELDKRGIEKKLQLDKATYKTLDERWTQQYDRNYNTDYAREYREKKDETREFKKQRAAERGKVEGKQPRPHDKPERARDRMTADEYREKDHRDLGVKKHEPDQKRPSGNKRFTTVGERDLARVSDNSRTADRAIDSSLETVQRAEQGASRLTGIADLAVRAAGDLHSQFKELGDRASSRELETEHDAFDRSRDDDDTGRDR